MTLWPALAMGSCSSRPAVAIPNTTVQSAEAPRPRNPSRACEAAEADLFIGAAAIPAFIDGLRRRAHASVEAFHTDLARVVGAVEFAAREARTGTRAMVASRAKAFEGAAEAARATGEQLAVYAAVLESCEPGAGLPREVEALLASCELAGSEWLPCTCVEATAAVFGDASAVLSRMYVLDRVALDRCVVGGVETFRHATASARAADVEDNLIDIGVRDKEDECIVSLDEGDVRVECVGATVESSAIAVNGHVRVQFRPDGNATAVVVGAFVLGRPITGSPWTLQVRLR